MPKKRPYCLTIAGFDPSGGAGILADIKTFEQFKVQGLAVQTANTIQTEDSFSQINWTDPAILFEQLHVVLKRYNVRFFKIGLIESGEILEKVISIITSSYPKATIVWDPILSATSGGNFDESRFSEILKTLPQSNLILTPNEPEFEALNLSETKHSIYLKGGHSEDKGKDQLFGDGKTFSFSPKIKTDLNKHGTGCILSSALLANLALEYPMIKACLRAKRYVEKRITSNQSLLAYHK